MPEIIRPAWDAWEGIGHNVLRYVQQMEWRVKELETRLSNAERLHAQELAQRDKLVAAQQRHVEPDMRGERGRHCCQWELLS